MSDDDSDDESLFQSEDWTKLVDRGGLVHISDRTFLAFATMELDFRQCSTNMLVSENLKDVALEKMLKNIDLLHIWDVISVNWGEAESTMLLKLIVEHWIKIRGFSAASAFMENYKKRNKRTVQKSKALRKSLFT